jgi:radical SAM protein with 4Fe4S-binding SPASM domain
MVHDLPRMIRYLTDRGTYVLFNTNGTLLNRRKGHELINAGLDELRVSLDAAEASVFKMVRGLDMFDRIVANVRAFIETQQKMNVTKPRVSLWLTGLKETIAQLPEFVRLAHTLGVPEVYLQRMVYSTAGPGLARVQSSLFDGTNNEEDRIIREAEQLAQTLGLRFCASGATEPVTSLKKKEGDRPWSLCRRPWTLMYFTAHGRAIPCCIAPFSMHGYDNFSLGNATQQTLREIWNGEKYQDFRRALVSDHPPNCCANCGLRWSL